MTRAEIEQLKAQQERELAALIEQANTALGRMLIGAVWQLARRLAALEGTQ